MASISEKDLVCINVLKYLIKNGCKTSVEEVNTWVKENSNDKFSIHSLARNTLRGVLVIQNGNVCLKTAIRLCYKHWSKQGCNKEHDCDKIHICKFLVVNKPQRHCRKRNCTYDHKFNEGHNLEVIRKVDFLKFLTNDELLIFFQLTLSHLIQTGKDRQKFIDICGIYNRTNGKCKYRNDCKYLHICEQYVNGQCARESQNCLKCHNFYDIQCLKVLKKHNWDMENYNPNLLAEIRQYLVKSKSKTQVNPESALSQESEIPETMNFNTFDANPKKNLPQKRESKHTKAANDLHPSKDKIKTQIQERNYNMKQDTCHRFMPSKGLSEDFMKQNDICERKLVKSQPKVSSTINDLHFPTKNNETNFTPKASSSINDLNFPTKNNERNFTSQKREEPLTSRDAVKSVTSKPFQHSANKPSLLDAKVNLDLKLENITPFDRSKTMPYSNLVSHYEMKKETILNRSFPDNEKTIKVQCTDSGEKDITCQNLSENDAKASITPIIAKTPCYSLKSQDQALPKKERVEQQETSKLFEKPSKLETKKMIVKKEAICIHHLLGLCTQDVIQCKNIHTAQPYFWQYKDLVEDNWHDFKDEHQEFIELQFREAENETCDCVIESSVPITINFERWSFSENSFGQYRVGNIRRLGTNSWGSNDLKKPFLTKWYWYWKDEFNKWKMYGEKENEAQNYKHKFQEQALFMKECQVCAKYIFSKGFYCNSCKKCFHARCQDFIKERNCEAQEKIIQRSICTLSSQDIERQYLKDKTQELHFKAGKQQYMYTLNLKGMQQKNVSIGTVRPVRRRPKEIGSEYGEIPESSKSRTEFPPEWNLLVAEQSDGCDLVEVMSSSQEYKEISSLFYKTMSFASIKKIQRLQNYDLWADYCRKKEKMLKANTNGLNEKYLFHGTKRNYIEAIKKQGFDWRLTGSSSGTAYGKGSYFARDAQYSHNYCDSSKKMFVVKVLVGSFCRGNSELTRPPPKNIDNPLENFYDSCVNNVSDPSIYVVFDHAQSYPSHIIEYS